MAPPTQCVGLLAGELDDRCNRRGDASGPLARRPRRADRPAVEQNPAQPGASRRRPGRRRPAPRTTSGDDRAMARRGRLEERERRCQHRRRRQVEIERERSDDMETPAEPVVLCDDDAAAPRAPRSPAARRGPPRARDPAGRRGTARSPDPCAGRRRTSPAERRGRCLRRNAARRSAAEARAGREDSAGDDDGHPRPIPGRQPLGQAALVVTTARLRSITRRSIRASEARAHRGR